MNRQEASLFAKKVREDLLQKYLTDISQFGRDDATGRLSRLAYTDSDDAALDYVGSVASSMGYTPTYDAYGNMFCIWKGQLPNAPIIIASHIDSVTDAGNYDGVVGIIVALEVLRLISKIREQAPFVVLAVFRCEEATRFSVGDLGSRLAFGVLKPEDVTGIVDAQGICLRDVFCRKPRPIDIRLDREWLKGSRAFFEAHIEQGPILDREGLSIGAVTGIAAFDRYLLHVIGEHAHSGTTDYSSRKDAAVGAAAILLELDKMFREACDSGRSTVATIGKIETPDGGINRVCGEARLYLDVRDSDETQRRRFVDTFLNKCGDICKSRQLILNIKELQRDRPVVLETKFPKALVKACQVLEVSCRPIVSGAAHDALIAAQTGVPTGMIFVPSVGGMSHCHEEFTHMSHIVQATKVLVYLLVMGWE